jgi:AcrR family transcriptional regulator
MSMATTDVQDTKGRLLDAAEALFGDRGVAGVSVREITAAADANIAAVNYHFGSKDGLLEEVLNRRMEPLNAERLRLLDLVESAAGDGAPTVEGILDAFVGPTFRMKRKHPNFMKVIGQLHHEPGAVAHKLLATPRFQELIKRLRSMLLLALPGTEPSESWWGMSFLIGAMIHTWMKGHEIEVVSGGEAVYDSDEAMIERLTCYAAAGLRALVAPREGGR